MILKFVKTSWLHIFAWGAMTVYFLIAPDLFTLLFVKNGKPLPAAALPVETDQITFVIDGLESYTKDREKLYQVYGWALMISEEGIPVDRFTREIAFVSDEESYFFAMESEYRSPELPKRLANLEVNHDDLGFNALIAEDAMKPGRYRIGVIFRDPSTGSTFYWDKPVHYLVKTPNHLRLEQK